MHVAQFFDTAYGGCERYWWRTELRHSPDPLDYPTSLLTQTLLRLIASRPAGRVLDLGAGEGADAIRLARLGYEVDAVDISAAGAEKIEKFASMEGVSDKVRVHRTDARDFAATNDYDIVISNGLLHYIDYKEPVVQAMQAATRAGGLNVVSLWSTYTPPPACHDIVPVYPDDEYGVVAKLYASWQLELFYFERDKAETAHSDLPPHRHSHIKLIARKP